MSSHVSFTLKTFPARVGDLEFSMSVPEQWALPELPAADEDFSDPTLFVPLMMCVAPTSPVVLAVAALYRSRMIRLKEAGDAQRSVEARQKAEEWIHFYAAQATSGGEGAALSVERDEFLSRL